MARAFNWNGQSLPYPNIDWSFNDISTPESGRNLSGLMSKKIVSTKRKLACNWKVVDDSTAKLVLNNVKSNTYGELTFPDALEGKDLTKTFYTGDVSAKSIAMLKGVMYWDISLDFIEK